MENYLIRSSKGLNGNILGSFPGINAGDDLDNHNDFLDFLSTNKLNAVEKISSSNDIVGVVALAKS